METFAPSGRIDVPTVDAERTRLVRLWSGHTPKSSDLHELLGQEVLAAIDPLDPVQLAEVIRVCRRNGSLSEAGRILFSASTARRAFSNDADRLRKYLHRYGIDGSALQAT